MVVYVTRNTYTAPFDSLPRFPLLLDSCPLLLTNPQKIINCNNNINDLTIYSACDSDFI